MPDWPRCKTHTYTGATCVALFLTSLTYVGLWVARNPKLQSCETSEQSTSPLGTGAVGFGIYSLGKFELQGLGFE